MLFWEHWFFPAFALALIFVLVIITSIKVRQYQRRFNSYYADNLNAPKITTRLLHILSWCFAPLAVLSVFFVDYRPYYYKYWLIIVSVLLAVLQYFSGRFCYRMDYDARYLADLVRKEAAQ